MSAIINKLAAIINDLFCKKQIKQLQQQVSELQNRQALLTKESKAKQKAVENLTQEINKLQSANERLSTDLASERRILSDAKVVVSIAAQRGLPLEQALEIFGHVETLKKQLVALEGQCHCGCSECNPAPVACTCGCPSCCQVVPGNTPKSSVFHKSTAHKRSTSDDDDGSGPRLHPLPSDGGIYSPK